MTKRFSLGDASKLERPPLRFLSALTTISETFRADFSSALYPNPRFKSLLKNAKKVLTFLRPPDYKRVPF